MNDNIIKGFNGKDIKGLTIDLEKSDDLEGVLILYLTGYIDTGNTTLFQAKITEVVEAGFTKLIFQCSGLNYVSSTGIGSFASFLRSIKTKEGMIVFIDLQPKVFEVFSLLGFPQFLNILNTIEEALAFLKQGEGDVIQSLFPCVIHCPSCNQKLQITKPGKFRCTECKSILNVDDSGNTVLLL